MGESERARNRRHAAQMVVRDVLTKAGVEGPPEVRVLARRVIDALELMIHNAWVASGENFDEYWIGDIDGE